MPGFGPGASAEMSSGSGVRLIAWSRRCVIAVFRKTCRSRSCQAGASGAVPPSANLSFGPGVFQSGSDNSPSTFPAREGYVAGVSTTNPVRISIAVCAATFVLLVIMLRRDRVSFGLPVAYLANLLLLHLPGAIGKLFGSGEGLTPAKYTRTGIIFTAIGSVAFVAGVWLARRNREVPAASPARRSDFWRYCVLAGGICTVLGYLIQVPSITAVLSRGGVIWMLGVLLGLTASIWRGDRARAMRWAVILLLYPVLMLLMGGFLSYGAAAVIIVLSSLMVTARQPWRVVLASAVFTVGGMSVFLSYFQHRPEIRAAVWGGASTDARIAATTDAIRDIRLPDLNDPMHLIAIDQRLNQNYFVGLAAERIEIGRVNYLHGRSLWEGVQALVPRALWPDKPVVAGSPKVVSEMTGLQLSTSTSFGVGNVMEFHINFGVPGVVIGFLILGFAIGRLDRRAAEENARGNLGQIFMYFVPAVALIQPNGSIVELMSGGAAGIAAALGWRWLWRHWAPEPTSVVRRMNQPQPVTS